MLTKAELIHHATKSQLIYHDYTKACQIQIANKVHTLFSIINSRDTSCNLDPATPCSTRLQTVIDAVSDGVSNAKKKRF